MQSHIMHGMKKVVGANANPPKNPNNAAKETATQIGV